MQRKIRDGVEGFNVVELVVYTRTGSGAGEEEAAVLITGSAIWLSAGGWMTGAAVIRRGMMLGNRGHRTSARSRGTVHMADEEP